MKNKSNNERATLWLDSFSGLTLKQKFQLVDFYKTPATIYENLESESKVIEAVVGETNFNKMKLARSESFIDDLQYDLEKQGIKFISREHENYSKLLATIKKPPLILYYKGDINLLNTFSIGIVGTRHCTHYGADCARRFARDLADNDITIVSGLATGIDTCAHEGALITGKTISVFAGGIDVIYPSSNAMLAKQIESSGLIITEHKPNTPPRNYNFPLRSRIITGLCRGLLIVESNYNGGTMHAKDYAISENRDVFCIPGNITSSSSNGTNMLIRNQEAICVLSPEDILKHYYITPKVNLVQTNETQVGGFEGQIVELLSHEAMLFEDLKTKLSVDAKTLMRTLTKLEIKGLIKKRAGNIYESKK